MSDRIFGIFGLLFAGLVVWATGRIEESFIQDPLGPKAFPLAIAALIALSGGVMLIKPGPNPAWPALTKWLEMAITVGVMVAYALVLPELGFVLSSTVLASFMVWRLGGTPAQSVVGGLVMSAGIYLIFTYGLSLSLAKGPWGF
ncbi:tripartite tricarboxylate transporter TctB family protein [Hydrogenophaga pseudoflava]|uniref:tripartite tricarboxylate transporter TctB family protein n=1 Tax=Hydrogenophaga pseudoflava TaxID=47421 RepID=UPI000826D611|nr:tripartite tricarboxylate transporter TctB family protein [Hydrogenophaga pseudoflava]